MESPTDKSVCAAKVTIPLFLLYLEILPKYSPILFCFSLNTSLRFSLGLRCPSENPPLLKTCISLILSLFSISYFFVLSKAKSIYFLYIFVTVATYSGLFILPSILKDVTPASINIGRYSKLHKSRVLSK